ncbi:MAG: flagellar assembly protein FliH [Methylobacter sp.]|uniref:Flagellar assembly protein FliH n=1 Tax=Candidatus Methylobacter titanis TaxID=3053457 RepID=A0AA43TLD5_9GAMM|nr:flagellar assembly protein FliH [Candidatus Methylobacter titanis]
MSLSKTPRFTVAELESLRLWSLPDVSAAEASRESETVEIETEPTPILTVDEIETMQKQAYDEAFAQGKMHGFQQGFDEGSKKGYDDNLHLMQSQAATLVSLLESLSEPFKLLDEEVEKELVKLAIGIATQIIRREIKLDPGQIVAVVRETINVLPLASQKISLKLHPEDAELVRSALALDEMSPSWKIVEDPLITRGGCAVDTDISHVDATVEHRLAAVISAILGGEREHDGRGSGAVADDSRDGGGTTPGMEEVEQRREQLPTTPGTGEVEQRREQLPRAPKVGALGDAGAVADDSRDGGGRATQGAVAEDKNE